MINTADLTRRESFLGILLSFFLAFVAFFPTLYGMISAPDDFVFINLGGTDEYNRLAWIAQVTRGEWLLKSPYYLGEHSRQFFHPFYLAIGLVARAGRLPAYLVFSLLRFPLSFIFFLSVFVAVAFFVRDKVLRMPTFMLTSLSGGLVWLDYQNPNPDWIETILTQAHFKVEANTFFIAKQDQATMLVVSLLIWSFLFFIKGLSSKKTSLILTAGLLTSVLLSVHPFMVATVYLAIFVFTLSLSWLERRAIFYLPLADLKRLAFFYLLSLPPVIYHLLLVRNNPMFSSWANDWIYDRLSLPELVSLFGILILPLPWGLYDCLKNRSVSAFFLIVWFLVSLTLPYLHLYTFSSRMMTGIHLPLSILAALGTKTIAGRLHLPPKALLYLLIILSLPATIYILLRDISVLRQHLPDNYLRREVVKSIVWIREKTSFEETVLAWFYHGHAVTALAGNQIFAGRQAFCPPKESLAPGQKPWCFMVNLDKTLKGQAEKAFLDQLDLSYFLIPKSTPPTGRLGRGKTNVYYYQEAETKDYLFPYYENKEMVVYKVITSLSR